MAFGVTVDTKPIDAATAKTQAFKKKLEQIGKAVVAAFAVEAVKDFIFGLTEQADVLAKQSQALGLSVTELQEWQYAADLAGVGAEEMTSALTKFNKAVQEGRDGTKGQVDAFKALGISAANLKLKTPTQLLDKVADGIAGIADPAKRTQVAMDLFGRAGAKLIPFLKDGSKGIAEIRAEVQALGGGFSEDFAKRSEEVNDQVSRLKFGLLSMKVLIVGAVLPAVNWLVTKLISFAQAANKLAKETNLIQAGLITLGAVAVGLGARIALSWAPVILTTVLWAAAIAAAALALDDIITFFQGGDSVLGRGIDALFGEGSSEKVRAWGLAIADAFSGFVGGLFKGAASTLLGILDLIAIACSNDADAVDMFGSAFLGNTNAMSDAIDALLGKLQSLRDLLPTSFADAIDTLKTGANDALDAAERGVSGVFGTETRAGRAAAAGGGAPAATPFTKESVRSAFLPPAAVSGPAAAFFAPAGASLSVQAPITQNIHVASGTPAAQTKALHEAAGRGSAAGVNRAAAASFDKRGAKK